MNFNLPPNLSTQMPLIFNPLTSSSNEGLIAPGPPEFVITDSGLLVTTDSALFVTTG